MMKLEYRNTPLVFYEVKNEKMKERENNSVGLFESAKAYRTRINKISDEIICQK